MNGNRGFSPRKILAVVSLGAVLLLTPLQAALAKPTLNDSGVPKTTFQFIPAKLGTITSKSGGGKVAREGGGYVLESGKAFAEFEMALDAFDPGDTVRIEMTYRAESGSGTAGLVVDNQSVSSAPTVAASAKPTAASMTAIFPKGAGALNFSLAPDSKIVVQKIEAKKLAK